MGSYVIAGGILSTLEFIETLPWLLLYNLIFISPMIGITLIIYLRYSTVEKVGGWKDINIKILHAIAGLMILVIGLFMVLEVI